MQCLQSALHGIGKDKQLSSGISYRSFAFGCGVKLLNDHCCQLNMFHITGQVHKLLGALNLINDAGILTDLYDLCESSLASKPASWTLLWTIVPI